MGLSSSSRGSDVEIYIMADARRNKTRGFRHNILGKLAYLFEHQGNDLRRVGEEVMAREGIWTVWVAVLEYTPPGGATRGRFQPPKYPLVLSRIFHPACGACGTSVQQQRDVILWPGAG